MSNKIFCGKKQKNTSVLVTLVGSCVHFSRVCFGKFFKTLHTLEDHIKCILYAIFKKIVRADFLYCEKQVFQAFKKFGCYDCSKNAHIKRMKNKIRACQKLKTFTQGIRIETIEVKEYISSGSIC